MRLFVIKAPDSVSEVFCHYKVKLKVKRRNTADVVMHRVRAECEG